MIGRRIGNYIVEQQAGEGGMGIVYRARHPRLPISVAIKVLRPGAELDSELTRRFFNEAQAASALKNEHIVDILDFGELEGGLPYIVMEWLDGANLASVLKNEKTLALGRALHIAQGICEAMAAAHAVGVVHRDLKPDNVFLVPTPRDPDFVKVLDFGIAKLSQPGTSLRTQTGALMGTPSYMSPEQCRDAKDADHRSDIYTIGVMVYEMVTGRLPFQADGMGELLLMHLKEAPEAPRRYVPDLPRDINKAILRALAKKTDDRFQSVGALAAALRLEGARARDSAHLRAKETLPPGVTVARAGTVSTLGQTTGSTAPLPEAPTAQSRRRVLLGGLALGTLTALTLAFTFRRTLGGGAPTVPAGQPAVGQRQATPPADLPPASTSAPTARVPAAIPVTQPPATPTPAPAEAPAPALVRVKVSSVPAGARVVRESDGHALGTTPYEERMPKGAAPLLLRLELPGFRTRPVTVPLESDYEQSFKLARAEGRPPEREKAPVRSTPAQKAKVPARTAPAAQAPVAPASASAGTALAPPAAGRPEIARPALGPPAQTTAPGAPPTPERKPLKF